ncbi:MAG: GNAT family N-acetyltransferase [Planctomycetota bacterium]|jgi:acyl-CoA hydrolase/GNAT superfamily N-acetyltransferase|nr:GNAT family N-acetyltransferase [Planctomycetota bacterium]MDP6940833.1 GNAT family N-acetyltransferase [Planctomycetota bacterium]
MKKFLSPLEAVNKIPSGSRVFLGSGAAAPLRLIQELARHDAGPDDAEVVQIMTLGDDRTATPEFAGRYRHNALFIGANVRNAVQEGRADYTPIHLHEIPELFRPGGNLHLDVALVTVSPPDSSGFVSLGVSVDVVKSAVENADMVIAEVCPNMPRTHGESFLHVDKIKWLVDVDREIPELISDPPGAVENRIGRFVADLVEDGSTLQLGIGKIPDAVLAALGDKKGLGIHTEMLSDGVVDLVRKGVIDNSNKNIHRGKIVASFAMGSRDLYDFIHDNPACEFRGSDYVNDPVVIARNTGIVCINSALQVDLTGQVCSDSQGTRFYSGVGGQVDFIRGAAMSKGGKPIIAMPSTAKGGTISKIVPSLAEGAGVVTSRADVHYVITEWGTAYLHGRTVRERAMELIHVAHPKFREELFEAIKDRAYIYNDQPKAPTVAEYPDQFERSLKLRNGEMLRLRPLRGTDEPMLREMFRRCSPITVHRRFLATVRSIGHASLREFMDIDYKTKYAQVAMIGKPGHGKMVGLAQYSLNPGNGKADVAFTVEDEWQHLGIGSALLQDLLLAAQENGIEGFTAYVQFENSPMLKVFHNCGFQVKSQMKEGSYTLSIPFACV